MSKTRLFAKIVYYVFTFAIGILLALFLPYYFFESGSLDLMRSNLESGNYSDAMLLVGGYFDKRPVLDVKFEDGGGIVLFESVTLVYEDKSTDEDKPAKANKLHLSYAGFVYGVKDVYPMTSTVNNQTRLMVTSLSDDTHRVEILDHDTNGDKVYDTNATFVQKGLFFLDLDQATFNSLKQLTFFDKDGNVFADISINLDFSGRFFVDVKEFVDEYNNDYKSDKLESLDKAFRDKDENYLISSFEVARSQGDHKAAIVVVVYFLCVYILADFLLGTHYIIRFFRWLLVKVFKVKFKSKAPKREEVFGHDYFSQVTFVLDISAVEGFSESVQIRYTDKDGEEISFLLLKEQDYKVTQRVKAGTYVNMWVDIDKNVYVTQNLPETLEVEGFQKALKIKIIKREE